MCDPLSKVPVNSAKGHLSLSEGPGHLIFSTYNKNKRQQVLHTSTIKWIYFTRGPNIFLCCPRMHRRCQCVRNSTSTTTNQCLQSICSFCSTIGSIIKPSVTVHVTPKHTGTILQSVMEKEKRRGGTLKK